jgi:hypothetical protein
MAIKVKSKNAEVKSESKKPEGIIDALVIRKGC